jgi:hypothetical protein
MSMVQASDFALGFSRIGGAKRAMLPWIRSHYEYILLKAAYSDVAFSINGT